MSNVLEEIVDTYEPVPDFEMLITGSRQPVVLALDIGTSGVRAALFDATGKELPDASIRVNYPRNNFAATGVTDADSLVTHVADTLDRLFANGGAQLEIQIIAISCFWHSLVGVSARDRSTTAVSGWSDIRASEATAELRTTLDEKKFHSITGCRFHSSYWPAKLLRLQREEPSACRITTRWLSFPDYLTLRLFAESETSVSMASGTGLLNQRTCDWEDRLLSTLKLNADQLPKITTSDQILRSVDGAVGARWPPLRNARLFTPIGDGAANNIGSGCTSKRRVGLMIGTSGAMRLLYTGEVPETIPSGLWSYRADRERVIIGGALSDGGNLYDWIRWSMLADWDSDSIEQELNDLQPDSHGLTILPFWSGERSTGWSTNARGMIHGATMRTTPIQVLRAAMEAVAYRFAKIWQSLSPFAPDAEIVASGYALDSSPMWVQIISDVLGRPIVLSDAGEASTRGAALLALEAAGKITNIEEFSFPVRRSFEPNMSHHHRYQAGLKRQELMYDQIQKAGW